MYYFYKREKKGCKLFILRKILYLCHTIEEGEFDRMQTKKNDKRVLRHSFLFV